jgi:hypothetical protein
VKNFVTALATLLFASTAIAQDTPRVWTIYGIGLSVSVADCAQCDEDTGIDLICQGEANPALSSVFWLSKEEGKVGAIQPLRLSIGSEHFNYEATTREMGLIGFYPEFNVYPGDPLLAALASGSLVKASWAKQDSSISLKGSKIALDAFKAGCGWNEQNSLERFEEKSITLATGGGSIAFTEVTELMDKDTSLEMLMALNERGVDAGNLVCSGTRLGRHWSHLGGLRIAPFVCDLSGATLQIEGDVNFLNSEQQPANPATLFETASAALHENFVWKIK